MATLHLLNDVTANAALLTLLTGPRWAIGPRDLRLLGRRAAVLAGGGPREADDRSPTSCIGIADGIDPAEIAALGDALDSPGDAAYSPEALDRFALLVRRAADAAARTSASRCSTSSAGSSTPPASTSSSPRPSRPAAVGPARQPRPVRQGGGGVPGRRRRRLAVRAAGLPHRRGRPGQRPRPRHPDRGRLGQAAHRPPRQGPGVGARVPGRRLRDAVPVQPVAHPVDLLAGRAAGPAARRRPRPAAAGGLRQGRARRLPRRTPAPTTRRRSSGWATSPSPAPPTASA